MLMNPSHQSGFSRDDSIETLLLRLLSDFYSTLAHGQVTLFALLDVSSAFDSVDPPVLIVPSHLSWLGAPASKMTYKSLLSSYVVLGLSRSPWVPAHCIHVRCVALVSYIKSQRIYM